MKKTSLALAALAVTALAAAQVSAAVNLLSNPGFESPLTDPPTSMGDWFPFSSGAPNGTSTQVSTMPHSGQMHMEFHLGAANNFAGVFQNIGAVSPGQTVTFQGWAKNALSSAFNATQEIKIEWQGGPPQNRIDVLTLGTDYEQFTHSAVAPAGTTGAVVTYAISNFGAGQGEATVYLDDMFACVVPEPASIGLLGLGALGFAFRRRK